MLLVLLAACLAGVTAVFGPIPAQVTAPVVGVTIDAAVVDGSGRPVPDLSAADFVVELDGRAQRVVAAAYHPAGAPMAGAIGPSFDAVTPASPVYRLVVDVPGGTQA